MHPKFAERIAKLHIARSCKFGHKNAVQITSALVPDQDDLNQVVAQVQELIHIAFKKPKG